jgi:hypothetical protein
MSSSSGTSSRVSGQSGSSGRSRRPGLGGDGSGDLYHGSLLQGHEYDMIYRPRPEPSNSASTSTGSQYPSSSTYARSGISVPNSHFATLNLPSRPAPSYPSFALNDPILLHLASVSQPSASQPSTSPSAVIIRQTPSASSDSTVSATAIDTEIQSDVQDAPQQVGDRRKGSGTPDTSQTNTEEHQHLFAYDEIGAAQTLTPKQILRDLFFPGMLSGGLRFEL